MYLELLDLGLVVICLIVIFVLRPRVLALLGDPSTKDPIVTVMPDEPTRGGAVTDSGPP